MRRSVQVPLRRALTLSASLLMLGVAVAAAVTPRASGHSRRTAPSKIAGHVRALGPRIIHTGRAPTGYEVTFRYYDPGATRVQIKGEWYFEDPYTLPQLASTPDYTIQTPGLMPTRWRPGDVPIASPNSTNPNWPVSDMSQIGHSGVWTYTTPLPSGVFSYGFYVDCKTADQSGCTEVPDPGNPAWTTHDTPINPVATSQVHVPSDARFDTRNFWWQGPAREQGTLTYVTYTSPGHVTPAGTNAMVVYTPPGYDSRRSKPYPTLYLSHGGGENEMGWSTQGDVKNILDNLIDTGQIQPMVVVMPNANGYPSSTSNQAYRTDLISHVLPYVQQHYDVATSAAERAYSGLSFGGMLTNQLMLYNTDEFGYYGMMSAGLPPGTSLSAAQIAALKKVTVFVGAGWQDPIFAIGYSVNGTIIHTGPAQEVRQFANAGIPVSTDFINGGHEWYVWRILLKDFLTRVAFWPSPAADWTTG